MSNPLIEFKQALQALAECEKKISILNQIVANREIQISILKQKIADYACQVLNLESIIDDTENTISIQNSKLEENDQELADVNLKLRIISTPLRLAKRYINGVLHPCRAFHIFRDINIIHNSNLFDITYYRFKYRDVRISACSPIRHYCEIGWKEGRNPSPLFDTNLYLQNNIEVVTSGVNPLVHFIKKGRHEGRKCFPVIDENKKQQSNYTYLKKDKVEQTTYNLYIEFCTSSPPIQLVIPVEGETVPISVIIPVYNQWHYTYACLNSIAGNCLAEDLLYEIILADDCSTDESINAANYFPGLRIVKTSQNLGFLRNCNHAAQYAKGKYILFLNNDTIVLPGWMSSLYQLMESDDSAGIIGSKLLYPDGTIQEAGCILWNDGSATNCGRYQLGNEPNYDYVREVDYVSGASLLIRRKLWEEVGGFDEYYENAYCEDSDLAMTVRAKGMRVLYQPNSEVIHFEHKTYNDERTDFLLPGQRRNIQRLREKWADEFSSAHLSPSEPEYRGIANAERSASPVASARRQLGSLNVLYFSPFPSHPSSHGNQATIQQFARRFQRMGHRVHFALLQSKLYSASAESDMRLCWDTLDILPNSHPLGANGGEISFDGWYEDGLGEKIRGLCAKYDIDVVFCSYVFHSKLLEFVPSHILKVIDTHDKMGNRYDMLRTNGQALEFFSCTPEEEGAYLRRADMVVARRLEEARYFDSVTGCVSAIVIPHVEEPQFIYKTYGELNNVGLVASANRINLAIVKDCLEAINHSLHDKPCPFTVYVAGEVKDIVNNLPTTDSEIFQKPWVQLLGFVPDIAHFYMDMDVVISPVTMGTGINVKTVQAMAFGMPLLTTAWGAKGIESGDPSHSFHNLDDLVKSLFNLKNESSELQRLADVSRTKYLSFYQESVNAMQGMFKHPKLLRF